MPSASRLSCYLGLTPLLTQIRTYVASLSFKTSLVQTVARTKPSLATYCTTHPGVEIGVVLLLARHFERLLLDRQDTDTSIHNSEIRPGYTPWHTFFLEFAAACRRVASAIHHSPITSVPQPRQGPTPAGESSAPIVELLTINRSPEPRGNQSYRSGPFVEEEEEEEVVVFTRRDDGSRTVSVVRCVMNANPAARTSCKGELSEHK
jgi:hypothetical protein